MSGYYGGASLLTPRNCRWFADATDLLTQLTAPFVFRRRGLPDFLLTSRGPVESLLTPWSFLVADTMDLAFEPLNQLIVAYAIEA